MRPAPTAKSPTCGGNLLFVFILHLPPTRSVPKEIKMDKSQRPFAVVEFEGGGVSFISTSWLGQGHQWSYWPKETGPNINQLIFCHSKPKADWNTFRCKVLKYCGKLYILIIKISQISDKLLISD